MENTIASWQRDAVLPSAAIAEVDRIRECLLDRPLPDLVSEGSGAARREQQTPRKDTLKAYHDWSVRESVSAEPEEVVVLQNILEELEVYAGVCNTVSSQLLSAVDILQELDSRHQEVTSMSDGLHAECNALVKEQSQLAAVAAAIEDHLTVFDEYDSLSVELNRPGISVSSDPFISLLSRLDSALDTVLRFPTFLEASLYAAKFRQLQAKCLSFVRDRFVKEIRSVTSAVQIEIADGARNVKAASETPDAALASDPTAQQDTLGVLTSKSSLLYVRYRTLATSLRPIIDALEERVGKKNCSIFAADCFQAFFQQRSLLLTPLIVKHIQGLVVNEDICQTARKCAAYLIQLCVQEQNLFEHFFSSPSVSAGMDVYLEELCMVFYDHLRPKIISEQDVDTLCNLADTFRSDVLSDMLEKHKAECGSFAPVIKKILGDVQERLIYRAGIYLREEIEGFSPADDDLDYPSKLSVEPPVAGPDDSTDVETTQFYTWYPTLQRTLLFLSKLYRCLETSVFESFAQEAVALCTGSFLLASKRIEAKSGVVHGQLFLIKHLLTLREQITPFDVQFAVKDKLLDFAHMKNAFLAAVSSERHASNFFRFSRDNAVLKILQESSPSIRDLTLDSRQDLERQLKCACEGFIVLITKQCIEEVIVFVTKFSAFQRTEEDSGKNPMLDAEKIQRVLDATYNAVDTFIPEFISTLALYLTNDITQRILYRPVIANVLDSLRKMDDIVENHVPAELREGLNVRSVESISEKLSGFLK